MIDHRRTLWLVTAGGLVLRLAVMLLYVDIPGDGPSRAALGYQWLMEPRFVLDGHWLPVSEILVGLASLAVPDPRLAARLLSVLAGTASIPLLARTVSRMMGLTTGLAAAVLLAVLPMHVALSASSLADAVHLCMLLLVLHLAMGLPDSRHPGWRTACLLLAGFVATGIRYEAWLLLPALGLFFLLSGAGILRSTALVAGLAVFPAIWIMAALGGPAGLIEAYNFVAVSGASIGGYAVGWQQGLTIALVQTDRLLGSAVLILAVAGLLLSPALLADRERRPALVAWLTMLLGAVLLLVMLAAERGDSFVDRYTTTAAVLLLPFAFWALVPATAGGARRVLIPISLCATVLLSTWRDPPELYLTESYSRDVQNLAAWLNDRPRDEPLLLTRMGWQSSYLPLFHRMARDQYRIVSWYLPEEAMRAWLRRREPRLLVTRDGDEAFLLRVQAEGWQPSAEPIKRFGRLRVHSLAPAEPLALPVTPPGPASP